MERLYVLVKNDMPVGYQAAQAGHAIAQWILENPNQTWNNNYLILLQVKNIDKWIYKLDNLGEKYTTFAEPDLNFQITSLATVANGDLFKNLKLIGTTN